VRGHPRQAARRSSPERTAPAIANSRNVRTGKARQPSLHGLLGTPRRPRAHTDHTSHSSPATCRSVAGSRFPQLHHIDCSPRQSAFPLGRSCGHRAPPPSPELVCGAGRYHRAGRRRAPAVDSAGSQAGRTTRVPSACPPHRYRAAAPLPDTGRVPMRGLRSGIARNTSKRALPARLNPDPPGRASSSRQKRTFASKVAMYKYTVQTII